MPQPYRGSTSLLKLQVNGKAAFPQRCGVTLERGEGLWSPVLKTKNGEIALPDQD